MLMTFVPMQFHAEINDIYYYKVDKKIFLRILFNTIKSEIHINKVYPHMYSNKGEFFYFVGFKPSAFIKKSRDYTKNPHTYETITDINGHVYIC